MKLLRYFSIAIIVVGVALGYALNSAKASAAVMTNDVFLKDNQEIWFTPKAAASSSSTEFTTGMA